MIEYNSARAALAALLLVVPVAGCQTLADAVPVTPAAASEAPPAGPAVITASIPATSQMSAASAAPGICAAPRLALAGPPPVPNKMASFTGGAVENVGRNVARNTMNIGAQAVLGQIPGIGGVVAIASAQTANKEIIRTAEDVRGSWTATDGAPTCGCKIELDRSGLFVTTNDVKPQGCATPALAQAAQWKVVDTGFASQDLVLFAPDGTTELARLDRKGVDYFQGPVNGTVVTIWR
jgi:hypothetical protein